MSVNEKENQDPLKEGVMEEKKLADEAMDQASGGENSDIFFSAVSLAKTNSGSLSGAFSRYLSRR